jgi:hypothetical protein
VWHMCLFLGQEVSRVVVGTTALDALAGAGAVTCVRQGGAGGRVDGFTDSNS